MRKKDYIVQLNYKDEKFCYVMKACQHISREQALSLITAGRLKSYQTQGLVRKVHYINKGKQSNVYDLTAKGRDWIKHHYPDMGKNFYLSSCAVHHNIALANQVIQREQQRDWLTERDLRQELLDHIDRASPEERFRLLGRLERGEISIPDGGYREGGELYCVEIINENYGQAQIQAKTEYAEVMGADLSFVRQ